MARTIPGPVSAVVLAVLVLVLAGTTPLAAAGYRMVDPPLPLDAIDLVAKGGRHVDKAAFAGRWTFLAFGYTNCPDICPTILANLAAVRAEMAKHLDDRALPRVVFVSVDPARDSPDYLADYVGNFGTGFVGATGSRAAIDWLVKRLGAFYRLGRKDKDGYYSVNHSAEIYLIDPQARLRARFMPPLKPGQTLRDFVAITGLASPRADAAPAGR